MSPLEVFNQPPIQPIYSQAEPNQEIDLGTIPVQFTCEGKVFQGASSVTMRFVPKEKLIFLVSPTETCPSLTSLLFKDSWDGKLMLTDRDVTLDVFCVGMSFGSDGNGPITFLPNRSGVTVTPPAKSISTATFHLFNFPDFWGGEGYLLSVGKPPIQGGKQCGRVILKADGWSITIAATGRTDDLCKALKQQGGFVITHIGKIERENGAIFSSEQLDDLLHCLQYYLSFALGRWAGVALPIGFDNAGKKVFEQWGLPMVAAGPWGGSCSWFDSHHGELLAQVFPGFMGLWKEKLWNSTFSKGLYWYLGACERGTGIGVDTGLILAQTALELLAWTYCVQDRQMISEKAFDPRGLSAADKLRILASSLDIPLDIPSCLSALHAQPGKKWQDGMDAITGIRNTLVHPNPKKELPNGANYEGWKLSLWYIDMVLLRLCGHNGEYSNRLGNNRWEGQVEVVPWEKKKLDKGN